MTFTVAQPATLVELHELLDAELAHSPSFRRHYSTHLAMSLVALHQLNAPSEVLRAAFSAGAREAEPRDDTEVLDERRAEVARDGIAATVRARVPPLAHGPASQLFHPLIRLGYALDVGHEGQVAAALLDWERRHQALPLPAPAPGDRRLTEIAADLAEHAAGTWRRTFDFPTVAARPELRAALDGIALDERTLDDLSAFVLAAHATADDFTTLHLVTGTRAVRTVAGWVDDDVAARLVGSAAVAAVVAWAAVGAPPLLGPADLDTLRRTPLPSRDHIVAAAFDDLDAHVVKLTNVALAEEARTGDPLYRLLAARVVGLAPRP